jgi:hypothetical protein
LFFDKSGDLVDQQIGFIDEASFERKLRELIDEPVASAVGASPVVPVGPVAKEEESDAKPEPSV